MALMAAPASEVASSRMVGRVRLPTPVGASLIEVATIVVVLVELWEPSLITTVKVVVSVEPTATRLAVG